METLGKAILLFSLTLIATSCDVEDAASPDDQRADHEGDIQWRWDEVDGAFYSVDSSEADEVDDEDPRAMDAVDELTSTKVSAACCKANCPNGYCKVPNGASECSCGCVEGGQPKCSASVEEDEDLAEPDGP